MKGDCDEYFTREITKTNRKDIPCRNVNTLARLPDPSEKGDEIGIYKKRLEELEAAFYYNLELISERDLELSLLEEQLCQGNERYRKLTQKRNELEHITKTLEEKYCRKIKTLEGKITFKDEEIQRLRRENIKNMSAVKKIIDEVKQQQQKQIYKLATKFETQKNEMLRNYREEIHEKERYYLLEIDTIAEKLEEAFREKDKFFQYKEKNLDFKRRLEEMERAFKEKESFYQEEIRRLNRSPKRVNTEIQCKIISQVIDKKTQTTPEIHSIESQTTQSPSEPEEDVKQKINFLQQQNEVLKWVIKDLKKNNRDFQPKTDSNSGSEEQNCQGCTLVKREMEQVSKKFETEISCLKKILQDEQIQRAEEESVIQSLESSVTCLKDKLLTGLQQNLEDYAGDDICMYTYHREIQNEIQVSILEEKLSKKIEALAITSQKDVQNLSEKLEELQEKCLEKMEMRVKQEEDSTEFKGESVLEKIRLEILKLENKIESDMKNIVRNNTERDKCDKIFQTTSEFVENKQIRKSICLPRAKFFLGEFDEPNTYYVNDIFPEKCISVRKPGRESNKFVTPVRKRKVR